MAKGKGYNYKLASLDQDAAINELAQGVLLRQIAARYNCDKSALYRKLVKHPDYKDAIAQQAQSFVEDAMELVMNCDIENVNIARARVDAAFKYAKVHNQAYADKPTLSVGINADQLVTIDAQSLLGMVRASQQNVPLIEKEAEGVQVLDN